jgi:hypothetical protein
MGAYNSPMPRRPSPPAEVVSIQASPCPVPGRDRWAEKPNAGNVRVLTRREAVLSSAASRGLRGQPVRAGPAVPAPAVLLKGLRHSEFLTQSQWNVTGVPSCDRYANVYPRALSTSFSKIRAGSASVWVSSVTTTSSIVIV